MDDELVTLRPRIDICPHWIKLETNDRSEERGGEGGDKRDW